MKRATLSFFILFPLVAFAGTARYTGANDTVPLVHPEVGASADGITLFSRGGVGYSIPVRLPQTLHGVLSDLAPGDFEWTIEFSQENPELVLDGELGFECRFVDGGQEWMLGYVELAMAQDDQGGMWVRSGSQKVRVFSFPRVLKIIRVGTIVEVFYSIEPSPTTMTLLSTWDASRREGLGGPLDGSQSPQRVWIRNQTNQSWKLALISLEGPTIPDVNNGETYLANADVNRDGKYNAQDIQLVVNAVLGIQKKVGQAVEATRDRNKQY